MISIRYDITLYEVKNDLLKHVSSRECEQLFSITSYSLWTVVSCKFSNIAATFIWFYMNLFVMIVSLGISTRFKQINDDLENVTGEVSSYIANSSFAFL